MSNRGILHKVMLFVILILGFGLALTLPAFKRHQDERHAREALHIAQQLVLSEQDFYASHGFYTADFTQFPVSKMCHESIKDEHSVLACAGYDIGLEEADTLLATNTKYPQWFRVALGNGKLSCEYENDDLVGRQLCRAVHL